MLVSHKNYKNCHFQMGSTFLSIRSMFQLSGQLLPSRWNSVLNCAINLKEIQVTSSSVHTGI